MPNATLPMPLFVGVVVVDEPLLCAEAFIRLLLLLIVAGEALLSDLFSLLLSDAGPEPGTADAFVVAEAGAVGPPLLRLSTVLFPVALLCAAWAASRVTVALRSFFLSILEIGTHLKIFMVVSPIVTHFFSLSDAHR